MAGTLEIPVVGSANSVADPRVKASLETLNNNLNSENDQLPEAIAKGFLGRFYAPKVIATEQTRESTSFGTLTTADEVTGVVLPENGLIAVGFVANWKSSVVEAGRAAIFVGSNQLKTVELTTEAEAKSVDASFRRLTSNPKGLRSSVIASFATTGETVSDSSTGGLCLIFAAAGTYNISVQFRATSGNITAKDRKLWVGVINS